MPRGPSIRPALCAGLLALSSCSGEKQVQLARAHLEIVGGTVDQSTTGVVSLTIVLSSQTLGYCSGTLIAPNLVLTARHCVSGMNQEQITCGVTAFTTVTAADVIYVSANTVRPSGPTGMYRVSSVHVPSGSEFCGEDIALVVLSSDMPTTVTPIVPRIDSSAVAGEQFADVGYGLTAPDAQAPDGERMRVDGNSVECLGLSCGWTSDVIRASEWSSLNAPTCSGDSGSPALDDRGRVFGVDSRGPGDCTGAIFTDVASWKDFIISTALEAATAGDYTAPFWTGGSSISGGADSGPLGASCTTDCGNGYACYSASGKPPGICVPRCSSSQTSCPGGYSCSETLGACIPTGTSRSKDSGGCSVAHGMSRNPGAAWSLLAAAIALSIRQGCGRVITTMWRSAANAFSWKRRSAARSGGGASARPSHRCTAR